MTEVVVFMMAGESIRSIVLATHMRMKNFFFLLFASMANEKVDSLAKMNDDDDDNETN